jgi:hypothetical protein
MSTMSTAAPSEAPDKSASRQRVSASAGRALLCLARLTVVLDVSIVNVALPLIPHALGFNQNAYQRQGADVRWVLVLARQRFSRPAQQIGG